MESNIVDEQTFSADLELPAPHFEDEATLLSARPVVPLQRLKAQARSGRLLAFGLAIVVALMAGALGATLVYKQRRQTAEPALVQTALSEPAPDLAANDAGGATLKTGDVKPSIGETEVGAAPQKAGSDSVKSPASLTSQRVGSAKSVTAQNETPNPKFRKEMPRTERVTPRLNRDARHEARRDARARRPADGLLRVREIFEGPPRP